MAARRRKAAEGGGYRAGAARVSITPRRLGLRLGGHARNRKATGILDPLMCRALILSDGETELAVAVLDLVGLQKLWVDRIRARVPEMPASDIWVMTTHTHDSPDTLGYFGFMLPLVGIPLSTGLDRAYLDFVIEQTAAAIRLARSDMRPARLVAARTKAPSVGLTRNVRREGFKEDEIFCLQARDETTGRAIATVTNYPCHPEMLGHENTLISAEFLTPFHEAVEARMGGTSLHLQGALGGMVTGAPARDDGSFDGRIGKEFNPVLGRRLAELACGALEEGAVPIEGTHLTLAHQTIRVPVDNWKFLLAARLGILPREALNDADRTVTTEVNLLALGPLRMLTMPGEVLPELGFDLKAMLACDFPMVVSLGCDELGYLLPAAYFSDPNYAYERSMSVGRLAEPILKTAAARLLERLPRA